MRGNVDAERYRRKAQHYLMCARQMSNPNARAALIEFAVHWEQMAEANSGQAPLPMEICFSDHDI